MTDKTDVVHEELVEYILGKSPNAKLYEHPASRTSEESMRARHTASGEMVTGAKALLIKMDVKDRPDEFACIILPGFNKLDSKALKNELKQRVLGMRSFRFSTSEEMVRVARGVQPGKMPPFGRPIFPDIAYTFVDKALLKHDKIGFNAAHFEKSIIMPTKDLLEIVPHDGVFTCSTEPES